MKAGTLTAIWRYPVKSLRAESLQSTPVHRAGIPHDRERALFVDGGHYARTGKTYRGKENNLLHTTSDVDAAREIAAGRGVDVSVRFDEEQRFFDAAPVSLIFDRWIDEVSAHLGEPLDPLRWRPNFYVRASDDFALLEPDLIGATIEIGTAVFRVADTIRRCVTTTYDIETGTPDENVLTYVALQRANVMGVYCEVLVEGEVFAGDPVTVRELRTSRTTDSSASI